MRSPFTSNAARWIGFASFFVACFLLFSYWTFPYHRVKDRVVREAAKQGYELKIVDLKPHWLTGVRAQGVEVAKVSRTGDPIPPTAIDELTLRASVLPLLFGTKSVSFGAELAGGELDGAASFGEADSSIEADFDNVELKRVPALRRFTKIPIAGLINGTIDIDLPEQIDEADGNIDIRIEKMSLGDGKAKIPIPGWGGLAIDEADVGTLEIKATTENGIVTIDTMKSDGKDIKLGGSGTVKFTRPLSASRADLLVRVKVEEAYKTRSPKVKGLFELAGGRPQFAKAKTSDGALQFKVAGAMNGRLRPVPAGDDKPPASP